MNYREPVEVRIVKFSPYGSPIPLVFAGQVSSRKGGFPLAGTSNNGGMGEISSFVSLSVNISKTVADTAKLTIND